RFALRCILDALRHRGSIPTIEESTEPAVILGRVDDRQPSRSEEPRDDLIAWGGRIYGSGAVGDPCEVVRRGLSQEGSAYVARLEGMFAGAHWSARERRLLLFRDRLGFRPLYFATSGGALFFASEVRSLLASDAIPRSLDREGLATFLWNGFVVAPRTLVHGVSALLPGHCLEFAPGSGEPQVREYWRVGPYQERPDGETRVRDALEQAVERQCATEGEPGFFLSGGIDSSAVVALAARRVDRPLKTFNIAFEFEEYDETPYAEAVARGLGTDHRTIPLTESAMRKDLEAALSSLDQPSVDGINTYFVSRAVREAGFSVALGGTGGDDLFGGNRTFLDIPKMAVWGRRLGWLPESVRRSGGRWIRRWKLGPTRTLPHQTRWGKLDEVLAAGADLTPLYQLVAAKFTPETVRRLSPWAATASTRYGLTTERFSSLLADTAPNPDLFAIAQLELALFLGDRLLRDIDGVTSAAGLEVRAPLLDEGVIAEWRSASLDAMFLPLGRKEALRRAALSDLDPGLFDRPKAGFVMPFERWFRGDLGEGIEAVFRDAELCRSAGLDPTTVRLVWSAFLANDSGVYWTRVWGLYVLLRWCRQHGVSAR
ncbi:MAG: asparagine synthetase B, partial [Planctomycetes bacterium]|nr:asparagine synthetase B [Planctomycetota bacterium]